jgi:hypothetical protein
MQGAGIELTQNVRVEPRLPKDNQGETGRWVLIVLDDNLAQKDKYSIVQTGSTTCVYDWDNWYDFPGSYWVRGKVVEKSGGQLVWESRELPGVDRGEPSRLVYFFHMMVGHHGVFSLTPVWILSLLGLVALCASRTRELHAFAVAVALISIVVIAFYLTRSELHRNYGGVSCGFRWLIWLAPLWLVTMIPAVDWIGGGERDRSLWWFAALVLLLLSAMTVSYAGHNPWSHPWLYQYWDYLQWPLSSHGAVPPGT